MKIYKCNKCWNKIKRKIEIKQLLNQMRKKEEININWIIIIQKIKKKRNQPFLMKDNLNYFFTKLFD